MYSPFQAASGFGQFIGRSPQNLARFGVTPDDVERAGGQVASGGLLSTIRAAGDMDRLETKIAKRTAAGRDTSRLTRKLERAQTSVRQIAGMTHPGLDVFNTAETTLGKLQTEQITRRSTPFKGMQGGERVLSPTGHPVSVRGRGGRYRAKFQGLSNRNYFAVPASARNIDVAADAVTGSRPSASKVIIGREKAGRGGFKYTATLADTGETRVINRSIGASFFAPEGTVGASGNALASSVGGAVNQSMMGYMRGAQGYLYSGNLTGLALEKAQKAQADLFKAFSSLDDTAQSAMRGRLGIDSVDDIAKRYLPGAGGGPGIGLTATIDDILEAQRQVGAAGGNAGRSLTKESFGVKKDTGRRIGRKQLSHNIPFHATGQDLVYMQQGGLGNMIGKNTELVESTARQVAITKDVSENLVRKESAKVAEREFYERTVGAQGKGLLRSFGIKNTAKLMKSDAGFRKIALSNAAEGAMRFANPIMTASFIYDISKMASTAIIGGGARLARDAVKSMQGSINKPSFGMGFVDNEVAATSRARGVMAIQNSRLNARSTLGAEASMMAAHFG